MASKRLGTNQMKKKKNGIPMMKDGMRKLTKMASMLFNKSSNSSRRNRKLSNVWEPCRQHR